MDVVPNEDAGAIGIGFLNSDYLQSIVNGVWFQSITSAFLVGLSGIFPLLIIPIESGPALKHGEPAKKLRLMLSFAVGSLLGDVFLHLLPEVWANVDRENHASHTKIGLWIIFGILAFLIVEKLAGEDQDDNQHEDSADDDENADQKLKQIQQSPGSQQAKVQKRNKKDVTADKKTNGHKKPLANQQNVSKASQPIKISGYLNLAANVVDNFNHGLAVAGSFCISPKVGLVTTLAILLHEIPHEVGDFAILLRSGFDRWKAAKAQLLTSIGSVIGAIAALSAESAQIAGEKTAWILPFTSGGFIYIALVTVVPDLLKETNPWESLKQVFFICLGVFVMVGVTVAFE